MNVREMMSFLEQYPPEKPVTLGMLNETGEPVLVLFDIGGPVFDKEQLVFLDLESFQRMQQLRKENREGVLYKPDGKL